MVGDGCCWFAAGLVRLSEVLKAILVGSGHAVARDLQIDVV